MQLPKDGNPGGTPLLRSFRHAWDGLLDAAVTQRNMRIHLVAGVLASSFAAAAPLAAGERAAILLCTALVVAAEAGNTALEALVDLHGGPPSEPARIAKDAAAGAVLVLAFASLVVFAVVLAAHWGDPAARWRPALPGGLAGLGLAALAAALVAPGRPSRAAVPLGGAAVVMLTLLAGASASPACTLMSAALVAIAAAAGPRGRMGHR